jgi:hypothetical protein
VVVSNAAGSATSQAGTLTVNPATTAPAITGQPQSVTVVAGSTANLSVTATGSAPLAYQWKRNGAIIPGATGATLTLLSVTAAQAGEYTVVVSNGTGSATSSVASLTVHPDDGRPQIAVALVESGKKLEITFVGEAGKRYGVLRSMDLAVWSEIAVLQGMGTPLSLKETVAVQPGRGFYRLRVEPSAEGPQIVVQPASLTVPKGSLVRLTVEATGAEPLQYQWRKDGVNLAGKTAATLTLSAVQPGNAGAYTVVVSNPAGSIESQPAVLEVETGD